NVGVHRAEKILRLLDVEAARKFLQELDERVARFGQLAFLTQLGGGLEIRQAYIWRGLDRDFAALLGAHLPLGLNEEIVTKERGAAENHHREQENEKPFHRGSNVSKESFLRHGSIASQFLGRPRETPAQATMPRKKSPRRRVEAMDRRPSPR